MQLHIYCFLEYLNTEHYSQDKSRRLNRQTSDIDVTNF